MPNRDADTPDLAANGGQEPTSRAEEQPNNPSEIWTLFRSVALLVCAVLVVGWIIG